MRSDGGVRCTEHWDFSCCISGCIWPWDASRCFYSSGWGHFIATSLSRSLGSMRNSFATSLMASSAVSALIVPTCWSRLPLTSTRQRAITHQHYRGEDSLWRTAKLHHKK